MAAADELGRLGPELDAEAAQSFDYVATEKAGEAPPRPERRPPYAVAYVVGGLEPYEVLVPGDATVVAEDGTLKITHGEGPVLAIVRTMPVRLQERSAGAAEDE